MICRQIESRVAERFSEVVSMAEQKYGAFTFKPKLTVVSSKGRSLGVAKVRAYNLYEIVVNVRYVDQPGHLDYQLSETIPHEVAHIVEHKLRGRLGHSAHWRRYYRELGGEKIARLANCGVQIEKARRTRRYLYILPNAGEKWVTAKYHNAIMRGQRCLDRPTGDHYRSDYYQRSELR